MKSLRRLKNKTSVLTDQASNNLVVRTTYDTMYHMTHARKRIRKLSTAVFRGARTEYSFDVYPISPAITDSSAVFVFSRRVVDKKGRAHHAVSCVGEAKSLVAEIKRHKRAKCVKEGAANVVCVLKDPDRGSRVDVVQDISEARQFGCVRGKYKPRPKLQQVAKRPKAAKVLTFKPVKPSVAEGAKGSHLKATQTKPKRSNNKRNLVSIGTHEARRSKPNASRPKHEVEVEVVEINRTTRLSKAVTSRSRAKIASYSRSRVKRAA